MRVSLHITDPALHSRVVGLLDLLGSQIEILEAAPGEPLTSSAPVDLTITDGASYAWAGGAGNTPVCEARGGLVGGEASGEGLAVGCSFGATAGVSQVSDAAAMRVVRLGVDVRIPGEEAEFLRIVEGAAPKTPHPVFVFAGAAGGVGTTSLIAAVAKRFARKELSQTQRKPSRARNLFVLNLVEEPTLSLAIAKFDPRVLTLDWDDIDLSGDLLTVRIPPGMVLISGTAQTSPPPLAALKQMVKTLSQAGPVLIDTGRFSTETATFCAETDASLALVTRKHDKASQYAQLKAQATLPHESLQVVKTSGVYQRSRATKNLAARLLEAP